MRICTQCGKAVPNDALSCALCGGIIFSEAPAPETKEPISFSWDQCFGWHFAIKWALVYIFLVVAFEALSLYSASALSRGGAGSDAQLFAQLPRYLTPFITTALFAVVSVSTRHPFLRSFTVYAWGAVPAIAVVVLAGGSIIEAIGASLGHAVFVLAGALLGKWLGRGA